VKTISASSREATVSRLYDGCGGYWQSSGSQGKHWIRLEIQMDILISILKMRVDTADSSYMPSLIQVSGGQSLDDLQPLATVKVSAQETDVVLLQDQIDYFKFLEIAIKGASHD
jgi:E3 ubiquitin-protein ligase HERC2